jgi:hypothetical protein
MYRHIIYRQRNVRNIRETKTHNQYKHNILLLIYEIIIIDYYQQHKEEKCTHQKHDKTEKEVPRTINWRGNIKSGREYKLGKKTATSDIGCWRQ